MYRGLIKKFDKSLCTNDGRGGTARRLGRQ